MMRVPSEAQKHIQAKSIPPAPSLPPYSFISVSFNLKEVKKGLTTGSKRMRTMKYNGQKNRDKKRKQRNNRLLKSEKEEYDKRYYLT